MSALPAQMPPAAQAASTDFYRLLCHVPRSSVSQRWPSGPARTWIGCRLVGALRARRHARLVRAPMTCWGGEPPACRSPRSFSGRLTASRPRCGLSDADHGIPLFSTNEDRPRADAEPEQVGAVVVVRYARGQGDRRASRCAADCGHSRYPI